MRILTYTTLYPNSVQQRHGIFVEQRLRKLMALEEMESKVVAPVPWFPFRHERFGHYSAFAKVPSFEIRRDIDVYHPRYPVIPKIGMSVAPFLLALFSFNALKKIIDEGYDFDLIDAHYYYPDGVAAALLAKWLNKPFVVTARGTDLTLISKYIFPRMQIRWAAKHADLNITVCNALKERLVQIDNEIARIEVYRNGVDLDLFRPLDRKTLRRTHSLNGVVLLSVGNLVELKGHDLVIRSLVDLPGACLLIVGDGEELDHLRLLTEKYGVSDRVRFIGAMSQQKLVDYYNMADILILASSREGWPNVLLESMACGTPVVATRVWGTPEVVQSDSAGLLVDDRSPRSIAKAVRTLLDRYPDRRETRKYAERFSWDETIMGIRDSFLSIVDSEKGKIKESFQ